MGSRVRELAGATPATRDRYVDLLRVASLAAVVLGHWLMAAVTPDGVGNLLAVVPALQPLTWLLQVMPVFFFVGGFSHALSYRSLLRKRPGGSDDSVYSAFLRARLQRLLRPTTVFVLVWGAAALLVQLLGGGGGLTGVTLRMVTQPLWFIGIYLAMVAFTPPLLRLHERYGWGAFAALAGAAAAVDVLRFAAGVPYVEFLNFAFVWLAVHQLGFLRADGRVRRPALLAGRAWPPPARWSRSDRIRCPWSGCPARRSATWPRPPSPCSPTASGSSARSNCSAPRPPACWNGPASGARWWRPTGWR